MPNHCFSFLEEDFPKISEECETCEKHLVEENYLDSIIHAGKACELITQEIAINNGRDDLNELDQYNRLNQLIYDLFLIPDKFNRSFHKIRRDRNDAIHKDLKNAEEISYNIHKRLFNICIWFYSDYGLKNFIPSKYDGPIYISEKITEKDVDEKINEKLVDVTQIVDKNHKTTLEKLAALDSKINKIENQQKPVTKINEEEDYLSNYQFEKKKGSYLLNELSKLNISSGESVENEDNLNDFKNYLHVDRSIQYEFINELERVVNDKSSHLIMLCGSVGDGKSHLLAYLKTKRPDLYIKFKIHSDATESHFTNKTSEDTLANVLSSFDDDNIDTSFEKLILAINLGVLNNFLESDYCKERYSKLKKIVDEANIFDSNIISENIIQDKVSFITFSDYNLFELNDDCDSNYVSSEYISALFDKITNNDYYNNPFYRAYSMDKESNYNHPIMYNFEILSDSEVKRVLIEYIIKIFVEYKKIISTRDLLNLIYELIVPPEFIEYSKNDNFEKLDKFIIEFNISDNLSNLINKYFDNLRLKFLDSYFDEYADLYDCSVSEKQSLIIILIRFALFYGKSNFKNNFVDKNYLNYLKYLYAYNIQNNGQYQDLFLEVKKAIFNLKGVVKKDYICIDELENFKISKELKLKFAPDTFDIHSKDCLKNRFKTSIKVLFFVNKSEDKIPLDVDYPLYSSICKLNKGYKPNKSEKENLILFEEFINTLIDETSSEDLIIKNTNVNVDFTFEYNEDFDSFTFERGD